MDEIELTQTRHLTVGDTASVATADYFEHVARALGDGKLAANWVMG